VKQEHSKHTTHQTGIPMNARAKARLRLEYGLVMSTPDELARLDTALGAIVAAKGHPTAVSEVLG